MTRPSLAVGAVFERQVDVTASLVEQFASVTGDRNLLHLDDAAARAAAFEGHIAHGLLLGSRVSAFLSDSVTGPVAAYVAQSLLFRASVPRGRPGDAAALVAVGRRRFGAGDASDGRFDRDRHAGGRGCVLRPPVTPAE